jgi:hypothetical protein
MLYAHDTSNEQIISRIKYNGLTREVFAVSFSAVASNTHYTLVRRKQHKFILIAPRMHATCFGPFSGHIQEIQYKHHINKDTMKLNY